MTLGGDWSELDDDDELDDVLDNLRPYLIHCESCGYLLVDSEKPIDQRGYFARPCASGQCEELCCASCLAVWGGDGPVMCPTCGSLSRWDRISLWIWERVYWPAEKFVRKIIRRPYQFKEED